MHSTRYKRLVISPVVDQLPKLVVDSTTVSNPTAAYESFDIVRSYLTGLSGRSAKLVNVALCQCEAMVVVDKPEESWWCAIVNDPKRQYEKFFMLNASKLRKLTYDKDVLAFTVFHECAHVAIPLDENLCTQIWKKFRAVVPKSDRTNENRMYYTWKKLFKIPYFHRDYMEDTVRQLNFTNTVFDTWYAGLVKFTDGGQRHHAVYGMLNYSEAVAQAVAIHFTDYKLPTVIRNIYESIYELVDHEIPR